MDSVHDVLLFNAPLREYVLLSCLMSNKEPRNCIKTRHWVSMCSANLFLHHIVIQNDSSVRGYTVLATHACCVPTFIVSQ